MTWSEALLAAAAIMSSIGAIGAVFYKRRQVDVDEATAVHTLVSSDLVKNEIERAGRELNAARDIRVLDLEKWADNLRPIMWKVRERDYVMSDLIKAAYIKLGEPVPSIPEFPEWPEFPAPRPFAKD